MLLNLKIFFLDSKDKVSESSSTFLLVIKQHFECDDLKFRKNL